MAKQTFLTTTQNAAWTTLVTGECTVAAIVANAASATTLVALRLTLNAGTSSYILPLNTLTLNTPARLAVGGIALKTGDKIEALSVSPVEWLTTTVTGVAYRSAVVTSPDTNVWTDLIVGPVTVRGLFLSSPGGGEFGAKVRKSASVESNLVLGEVLSNGESKRLMVPIVLASGESIQVKGTSTAYWIATGVQ